MEQISKEQNQIEENQTKATNYTKLAIITIGVVIALVGAVYIAYRFSQAKEGSIVLPGGITYLGPSPTLEAQPTTPPPPKFTADETIPYKEFYGHVYPFSFSYPETLPLVIFSNDPTNMVAIVWANIPPQQNVLVNVELIEIRDKSMLNKSKREYVEIWWKFFSGLKGAAAVTPFTNINGLKGYKAQYINWANQTPNLDVFFEVPGRSDIMIHLANGILDATIFNKIVDSVKWLTTTPTPQ